MPRVIGVLNFKGGTGKTTTVVNLAAGLALRGERVLCIDLDAQGSLATCLGVRPDRSLADLLLGAADVDDCIVRARDRLDLIASDGSLLQAEGALWGLGQDGATRHVLAQQMSGVDGYDYVLLDHSPSASLINENGLVYASQVIIPVSMNHLAMIGARQVLQTLDAVGRNSYHGVELGLILPTFYFGWLKKDRAVMAILQRHFPGKVADPIRSNVQLAEALGRQKSIYEYAPTSTGAVDYARLVERLVSDGKG
jgi:chromosome partitioning protein